MMSVRVEDGNRLDNSTNDENKLNRVYRSKNYFTSGNPIKAPHHWCCAFKKHSRFSQSESAHNLIRLFNLVAMAAGPHPFPSRTRSLSPPAPMVLHSMWESRSSPGFFKLLHSRAPQGRRPEEHGEQVQQLSFFSSTKCCSLEFFYNQATTVADAYRRKPKIFCEPTDETEGFVEQTLQLGSQILKKNTEKRFDMLIFLKSFEKTWRFR